MKLWAWGQSDPGKKRERNEDAYLVDPSTGVMAVADGMGGHQGGATASRMAVEMLGQQLAHAAVNFDKALMELFADSMRATDEAPKPEAGDDDRSARPRPRSEEPTLPIGSAKVFSPALEVMRQIVRRASSAIYEAAVSQPELRGMGTTLTALLVHAGRAHVIHAGDSRCYMFRDGALSQLTDDHSWIAEQLRSGTISEEEAKNSRFRHVITKSIGFEREIEADVKTVSVRDGDRFLLCSDGLSNYVDRAELERLIATTWYRALPATLVDLANERGGDDNITVVVGMIAVSPPRAAV